jgi:hypothetical protein
MNTIGGDVLVAINKKRSMSEKNIKVWLWKSSSKFLCWSQYRNDFMMSGAENMMS